MHTSLPSKSQRLPVPVPRPWRSFYGLPSSGGPREQAFHQSVVKSGIPAHQPPTIIRPRRFEGVVTARLPELTVSPLIDSFQSKVWPLGEPTFGSRRDDRAMRLVHVACHLLPGLIPTHLPSRSTHAGSMTSIEAMCEPLGQE